MKEKGEMDHMREKQFQIIESVPVSIFPSIKREIIAIADWRKILCCNLR